MYSKEEHDDYHGGEPPNRGYKEKADRNNPKHRSAVRIIVVLREKHAISLVTTYLR